MIHLTLKTHLLASVWVVLAVFDVSVHGQICTDGTIGPPAQCLTGPEYIIGGELGAQVVNDKYSFPLATIDFPQLGLK